MGFVYGIICYKNALIGRLAQLVERHVYTVNVGGSNPSPPTNQISRGRAECVVDEVLSLHYIIPPRESETAGV